MGRSLASYSQDSAGDNQIEDDNNYQAINDFGDYAEVDLATLNMAEYTDDDEDVTAEETRAPLLLEAERVVANNTNAIVACDNNALVKSCDTIPQQFDTVLSLKEYWDSVVVVNDLKSKKWRKGWSAKDRKFCHASKR